MEIDLLSITGNLPPQPGTEAKTCPFRFTIAFAVHRVGRDDPQLFWTHEARHKRHAPTSPYLLFVSGGPWCTHTLPVSITILFIGKTHARTHARARHLSLFSRFSISLHLFLSLFLSLSLSLFLSLSPPPLSDKPCYYHYHYHYRSYRPLDESHILINNMTLLKLRKVTFRIFVSCHFIN